MATVRKPIVLIGNTLHTLPDEDTLPGLENFYSKAEVDTLMTKFSIENLDLSLLKESMSVPSYIEMSNSVLSAKTSLQSQIDTVNSVLAMKANTIDAAMKSDIYTRPELYTRSEVYNKSETLSTTQINSLFANLDLYNKTEVNSLINNLVLSSGMVTTSYVDQADNDVRSWASTTFATKSGTVTTSYLSTNNYLTKGVADTLYMVSGDYYTISSVNTLLSAKANVSTVYNRTYLDTELNKRVTDTWVYSKFYDKSYQDSNYYKIPTIDTKFSSVYSTISTDIGNTRNWVSTNYATLSSHNNLATTVSNNYTTLNNKINGEVGTINTSILALKSQVNAIDVTGYVTSSLFNSTLANYVKTIDLATQVARLDGKIDNIDTATYATITLMNNTLTSYAKTADLTPYALTSNVVALTNFNNEIARIDNVISTIDVNGYVPRTELESNYITTTELQNQLSNYNMDLSAYATTSWVQAQLANVTVDLSSYYTKTQVNTEINNLKSSIYTTSQTDSLFYKKSEIDTKLGDMSASISDTYTKSETYTKNEVYTKQEADTSIDNKIDSYNPLDRIEFKALPTIEVSDITNKTITNIAFNPKFVQVFINRIVLYPEEYTTNSAGTQLTLNIDLIKGDKIRIFTAMFI